MKIYLKEKDEWKIFDVENTSQELIERNIRIVERVSIGEGVRIAEGVRIEKTTPFIILPNAYKYLAAGYFDENKKVNYVQLGCYARTVTDWEKDFWNNNKEFPEGSPQSIRRWNAFNLIKNFLESQLK